MMTKGFLGAVGLALLGGIGLSGTASATVLLSENFNSYYGYEAIYNARQPGSNLVVHAGGKVAGWSNSTANHSLNALDRGSGDMAIMFFDGTQIYYGPIAANDAGKTYTVAFEGALTTYSDATQVTAAGDYVLFLLNDATGTIASYKYYPSLTTSAFLPDSFSYVGTGSGSVYLLIKDGIDNDNRFGGAIDNVTLSTATVNAEVTDVPEPASLVLLASGALGLAAVRRRNQGT